jgi:hypothetical protein
MLKYFTSARTGYCCIYNENILVDSTETVFREPLSPPTEYKSIINLHNSIRNIYIVVYCAHKKCVLFVFVRRFTRTKVCFVLYLKCEMYNTNRSLRLRRYYKGLISFLFGIIVVRQTKFNVHKRFTHFYHMYTRVHRHNLKYAF